MLIRVCMKKMILLAAIASITLASCVKNEVTPDEENGSNAISYQTVVGTMSRALSSSQTTFPTTSSFGSFAYFVACIALVGFSFGGLLVVFAPMVKTIFGSKYYNRNYGLIFIGYGIGAFVGPKISASFFDATGSYVMGFIGSAILAAVAVLLVIVAKKLANKMLSA